VRGDGDRVGGGVGGVVVVRGVGVLVWVGVGLGVTGREVVHDVECVEGPGKRLLEDLRARD
jgi:hypothetical protein